MKKIILSLIVLLSVGSAYAQSTNFEEIAKIKGVEYTHVDKDMIKLAAKQGNGLHVGEMVNLGDGEGEEFLNQFDDVMIEYSQKEKE